MNRILSTFKKVSFVVTLVMMGFSEIHAQAEVDTLWVSHQKKNAYLEHVVRQGETVFMLAQRFDAPVSSTTDLNKINYSDALQNGSLLKIPIGKFNYLRINSVVASRPIYYRVKEGERLRNISRIFKVAQSVLQQWNRLPLPEVFAGQVLQVGWVKFNKSKIPAVKVVRTTPAMLTGNVTVTQGGHKAEKREKYQSRNEYNKMGNEVDSAENNFDFSEQFSEQNAGKQLQEASGAAVFFATHTPDNSKVYYAFYDDAPRGTILSIFNPSSQEVVYAKVIGPLPKIGKYHNSLIGLSANAAKVLRGHGQRIFVKIKYYNTQP